MPPKGARLQNRLTEWRKANCEGSHGTRQGTLLADLVARVCLKGTRGVRVRVLVLTPQPLDPVHDGLNLHVYHLFRALAMSHDVWILFLTEGEVVGPEDGVGKAGFAGVRGVRIEGEAGAPFRHCRDFSDEAQRAIEEFLDETPIDAIVAESIYMVPYARRLRLAPLLLDLVDDMSLLVWRSFRSETNWIERARFLRAWHIWRRYERQNLPAFPSIAVTSPEDARHVAGYAPGAEVTVLPNGVDAEFFEPLPTRWDIPEVVFTGVMGFRPNEVAAEHFYTRMFPRIRAAIPEVRLTIAGKGPTRRLEELFRGDSAVTLTGYVEDIRPYIGRASVYVAPMVSGSGIKNKILEAWAMARPVVATPIACDSLEGMPGETHFVAESAEMFADTVISLLKDRELGDEVGRKARRLVLDRYQWTARAARLAELLARVGDNRREHARC